MPNDEESKPTGGEGGGSTPANPRDTLNIEIRGGRVRETKVVIPKKKADDS